MILLKVSFSLKRNNGKKLFHENLSFAFNALLLSRGKLSVTSIPYTGLLFNNYLSQITLLTWISARF